jgi:glycosyltransferase A (GT-A) superfamily protein (DUF2064 family)
MARYVEKQVSVPRPKRPRPRARRAIAHAPAGAGVVVLARSPTGMGVRTPLARAIGGPDAALVYHRLLERTLRHLARGEVFPVVAVPPRCPEFAAVAARTHLKARTQPRGDMGMRIAACIRGRRGPCVVVDSDAPAIDALLVRHAALALGMYDMVLGPTWNGGYYLIGLRSPAHAFGMFKTVRWGTSHVFDDTLANVPAHWKVGLLPVLADANDAAVMEEAAEDHAPPRRRSSSPGVISTKVR